SKWDVDGEPRTDHARGIYVCRAEVTTTSDDSVRTGGRTWRLVIPPRTMVGATIARIRARRARPNLKASPKTRALDEAFRGKVEEVEVRLGEFGGIAKFIDGVPSSLFQDPSTLTSRLGAFDRKPE